MRRKRDIVSLLMCLVVGTFIYKCVNSGAESKPADKANSETYTTSTADYTDGDKANDGGTDGRYGGADGSRDDTAESYGGPNGSDDGLLAPVMEVKRPSQILHRYAYVVSYNRKTRCPNWVAWELTADHSFGPVNRKGYRFHEDDEVPAPRADYSDYKGSPYGMQRGHMNPAGDNKWSERAMDECHLMTNICPQYGNLNGGDWKDLEEACRTWAQAYDNVFIVCGPIFTSKTPKRIGYNDVAVPDGFFKVVLRLGKHPQALGFIYPNSDCSGRMSDYVMSVDDVEKAVGMDFFAGLNDNTEKKVERRSDLNAWK